MSPERAAIAAGEPTVIGLAGKLRIALRMALLLLAMLVLIPPHYLFRIVAYGSPFFKLFLKIAGRIAGARVKITGTALRRDVVFLSNHVSWLDILVLSGASGTAFVSKAEVADIPVVNWLARLNRTVYVQREARMSVAEQINEVREALVDNWAVTIFPEGTTSDGRSLLPFKTSMLKILEPPPPGVMVQPVLLDYGKVSEEISWLGEESTANNAMRIFSRRGSFEVNLHFLEPFSPAKQAGRKAIGSKARDMIEAELERAVAKTDS